MDPLLAKQPHVSTVDLKRVDLYICCLQNTLGVALGVALSLLLPHYAPGSAMRVCFVCAAVHLLATRWTLLPAPPYVRRYQKLLFFASSCVWIRLLLLEAEAAEESEHSLAPPPNPFSPATIATVGLFGASALHRSLFPCRPDAQFGNMMFWGGLLTGVLILHVDLGTLDILRPLSSDVFRADDGAHFVMARAVRTLAFLVVLQTQSLCELQTGNELDADEMLCVAFRSVEAAAWTLVAPLLMLPFAAVQLPVVASRRFGLWGGTLDRIRLVWIQPNLSASVSKVFDSLKPATKRQPPPPTQPVPVAEPVVSPSPSPPPPPVRIVADWSDVETSSLLVSQPRPEDIVAAVGKSGNEFALNPHAQRTLNRLQVAITERM